jgi:hypothetical protein
MNEYNPEQIVALLWQAEVELAREVWITTKEHLHAHRVIRFLLVCL